MIIEFLFLEKGEDKFFHRRSLSQVRRTSHACFGGQSIGSSHDFVGKGAL
jgi:hypothetical protein